eukprot:3820544-Amphidinium_carterae.1
MQGREACRPWRVLVSGAGNQGLISEVRRYSRPAPLDMFCFVAQCCSRMRQHGRCRSCDIISRLQ